MYDLEYLMYFGVPSNKLELIDGTSRWRFPFSSRDEAKAHYGLWLETLCRWKQIEPVPHVRKSLEKWTAQSEAMLLELFPRPINLELPIAMEAFDAFLRTFNRRDLWPGQPPGLETGWDNWIDVSDVRLNLWQVLKEMCARHGGQHSSRTDIALSDTAAVTPGNYYYRPGRENIMIEGDYFRTAPDLIAEVLSAPSRALDRGPRQELYRRSGVRHLWLLEPALETIEVYVLDGEYKLLGTYGVDDCFTCELFPQERIAVAELFDTQRKRKDWKVAGEADPPYATTEWILPEDFPVGLEYFFHLGHPERRWEFWDNKARSVLAFGSSDEARHRLAHFVQEASRWVGAKNAKISSIASDVDLWETGPFQLRRQGRLVHLDVSIDGRRYQELLKIWGKREAWDWDDQ